MFYDLQTNEYKVTNTSKYDFFSLSYYYFNEVYPEML